MSHNQGVDTTSPSRRTVVKGAAWAVPAVIVAGAAPTVAASKGPLEFTGHACKLPGNSTPAFNKGYVFELVANNTPGPGPITGVTVITDVAINGSPVDNFQIVIVEGPTCSCGTCTPAGATECNSFCTPDASQQRILVYTETQANSQNSEFTLSYQRYECGTCVALDPAPVPLSSGVLSTPPNTGGGGSCDIVGALPPPPLNAACFD